MIELATRGAQKVPCTAAMLAFIQDVAATAPFISLSSPTREEH